MQIVVGLIDFHFVTQTPADMVNREIFCIQLYDTLRVHKDRPFDFIDSTCWELVAIPLICIV